MTYIKDIIKGRSFNSGDELVCLESDGKLPTIDGSNLTNVSGGSGELNVNADWNSSTGDSQILNKPTIPSNTSDLTNDSGFISDISSKADVTYVDSEVAGIVDSSPATLDTLNELAAALGDDPNFATTVSTQIGLKASSSDVYNKTEIDTSLSGKSDIHTHPYSSTSHNHTGVYEPIKGADDNFVTDTEKIVIVNTSGTNSGDQDISGITTNATAIALNTTHKNSAHAPSNANNYIHPASHAISEITNLQISLDGKEDSHSHPYLLSTGGTITGALDIGNSSTTTTDVIFGMSSGIANVKTELYARGTQRWDFTDGSSNYAGSIQYSTPGGNPGIILRGATELGRTDIGMNTQTGGLAIGTSLDNSNPPTQLLIEPDNNVSVPLGNFTVTTGNIIVGGTVDGIDIATDVAANTAKVSYNDAAIVSGHTTTISGLIPYTGATSNVDLSENYYLTAKGLYAYDSDANTSIKSKTNLQTGYSGMTVTSNDAETKGAAFLSYGSSYTGTVCGVNKSDANRFYSYGGDLVIDTFGSYNIILGTNSIAALSIDTNQNVDVVAGNLTVSAGNIIVAGTVDGINIGVDVAANTAKTGITSQQATDITTNNAKVSYTDSSAVSTNTAKVSYTKTNIMGQVVHGATAGTARPSGFDVVTWIGSVSPDNSQDNDIWIDTT